MIIIILAIIMIIIIGKKNEDTDTTALAALRCNCQILSRKSMLRLRDVRPCMGTALALISSRMCILG